ncbi:MAG: winged helix-turn-helix transcriptional regulator [Bacillaceae bacterium]|nr:winged helix-turn-helix transcriptional regulator [Bacillaceae bacterium]
MQQRRDADQCEVYIFDPDKVNRLKEKVGITEGLALLFKALADDTRVKIAYALTEEDELCVCDVANIVGSTTATASHHLRVLRNMGLARYQKRGKMVFYSLKDDHVRDIIKLALVHHREGHKDG